MYIIAEIGSGHQGDLTLAKELIHATKESGADCAKFQAIFADEIVHPNVGRVPLPTGEISLYEKFLDLECSIDFYARLKEETQAVGLDFLCTPFGLKSLAMLKSLNVDAYKVASPELNHVPLLQGISQIKKPVFLSLGVSKMRDIDLALEILQNTGQKVTLLNCVTSYPAPEEDYNLNLLPHLAGIFNVDVGISDHSMDPILVPALSVFAGGRVIEKHICLSRSGDGLDDPIALEPKQFASMVQGVKRAQTDPDYLFYLEEKYGKSKVRAVMGDGIKKLAPSEIANYGRTNRSICACNNICAGDILNEQSMGVYRVEKMLRPGVSPEFWNILDGKTASKDIPAGQGIRWEDVL
ncbi:MAG: N-acetylneuraminate synthase family protein [Spirochaetia bacterium]